MTRPPLSSSRLQRALGLAAVLCMVPVLGAAQDEGQPNPADSMAKPSAAPRDSALIKPIVNTTAGEFTPGRGFQVFTSKEASLNISLYSVFRWIDQTPGDQTYTDHLGNTQTVSAKNTMLWQRTLIWFTGFFGVPSLRYNVTIWSLAATQQTLFFGNLQYTLDPAFTIGVGMGPNLTVRSMQGSFPYWAGSDRQMAEEFMRGGFSTGVFITGQPLNRFWYTATMNMNLSQLGVTASNDARSYSYSTSVQWMPTTGEFGPRGGFGDAEEHKELATRFGSSFAYAPSEYRAAPLGSPNNETQLRFSDGDYVFAEGSLAPGVTVNYVAYTEWAVDIGLKYKGWAFQGESYLRKISNIRADGPVPESDITDYGAQAQLAYMLVPHYVDLYVTGGYIWDQFKRYPWEVSPGFSVYPLSVRNWRIDFHMIHVYKSPTGSTFGYYTAGQTGNTYSIGTDFLF